MSTPIKVADKMVTEVITISEDQSLRDALELFQRHHIRQLPVLKGGDLVGILSDRDARRATPSPISGAGMDDYNRIVDSTRVAQLMTRNPYSVTRSTPLRDAVKALYDRKHGAIPVVEGNKLVGLVTATDMLKHLYTLLPE
jgi:acetoin utilization protein AcuB